MGFAETADVPVALVGDIDRGGVIAALVGTHALLDAQERARVKAFVINRFRGDASLFDEGLSEIVTRTGWSPLGIVPYFADAHRLPAEDVSASPIRDGNRTQKFKLPCRGWRVSPTSTTSIRSGAEPDVEVRIIERGNRFQAIAT